MANKIKKAFFTPEFLRFIIIGIINTIDQNIVYLILLPYMNYMLSNFIAFLISMTISFFLSCYFTFKVKATWKKFIVFPLSNLPNLLFQTVGIYVIVQVIGIPKQYGSIIATLCALPFTFLIMRFILMFKKNKVSL